MFRIQDQDNITTFFIEVLTSNLIDHFDIVTIKMKPCLICYANCDPHPGENEASSDLSGTRCFREEMLQAQSQSLISKQVDTIFILRKLFEVPLTHLELFLQNEGNPEDWISLCGTCKESTERASKIYEGILEAKEKFREIRKDIAATVRSTFKGSIRKGRKSKIGSSFVSVVDECRSLLKDQKIDDTKKDFAVGDHQADEHLKRLTILKYEKELVEPKLEQNLDINEYSEDHLWNPIPEDTYAEDPDFYPSDNKEDEDDPLAFSSDEESRCSAKELVKTTPSTKTNLPQHKDFRKNVRPITCPHCTAKFLRKKTLEAHVKNRHSSSTCSNGEKVTYFKEKSCPQCELTFASQHSLDKHFKHVHLRQSSADSSEVVKKSFTKTNLPKHKDFRKPVRAMKCDHCTATFLRRTTLEAHVKLRHSSITGSNNGENENVTNCGEKICPHCELTFASQHTLDKHVKHVHLRQFSASSSKVANKTSFTKTNSPKHKDYKRSVRPLKCAHCNAAFLRKPTLEAHVKLRHSSITGNGETMDEVTDFKEKSCPQCELTFSSQYTLEQHVAHIHLRQFIGASSELIKKTYFTKTNSPKHKDFRKRVRPIKCVHCTATFLRKTTLESHVKIHHFLEKESSSNVETKKENRKCKEKSCPHCELTFASQHTLDKHVKYVHLRKFKYTCPICNQLCLTRPQFTKHISETHKESDMTDEDKEKVRKINEETETGNQESCPLCEKKFTLTTFYRHFKKDHPDFAWSAPSVENEAFTSLKAKYKEKNKKYSKGTFICSTCGHAFRNKYSLMKHIRFQHEKKFNVSCDICGKGMRGAFQLRLHLAQVHKIGTVSSKRTCSYEGCTRVCWTLGELEDHLSTHTKTPRYQCNQCGAMSYTKKHLKEHQQTHLTNRPRPFACNICEKRFSQKSYLPYHMKTHDKQKNQKRK